MNKNAIVILGFGGVGKTELSKKYKNVIDLESIRWKWCYSEDINQNIEYYKSYANRTINPNFPNNYIEAIKKAMKEYDIICCAYSDIICKELKDNKIDFCICYPEKEAKDIYIDRFRRRGNNEKFINNNIELFEKYIDSIEKIDVPKMVLHGNETLEDYLIRNKYYLELKEINK